MVKFQIQCPTCNKNVDYNILQRDYDTIKCPHCNTIFAVQMRYLIPVISLTIFICCYQLNTLILKDYIPMWITLISGIMISFSCTLLIGQILSKKYGSSILFETMTKKVK